MINIDKIFVLHHTPLIERKTYLNDFFLKNNIDVEWVENYSPEDIENKYNEYIGDISNIKTIEVRHPYGTYESYNLKLTIGELSLYLKHKYCFEKTIKENYKNILILEDDITLRNDLVNYLNKNIEEFNNIEEFGLLPDILVIGMSHFFISKNIRPGKYTHFGEHQLTRCTHAILYNSKCIPTIYNHLYPIHAPIDHKLDEIIVKENLKVSWSEPGIWQNYVNFKSSLR